MFHNSQVPSVPVLLGSCQADCRYHNSQLNIPSRPQSPLTSFPLSSGSGSDEGSEESSEMRGVEWLIRHQAEGISSHSHILNLSAQPHSGSSNIALSQCHRPSSLGKLSISMHCPGWLGLTSSLYSGHSLPRANILKVAGSAQPLREDDPSGEVW